MNCIANGKGELLRSTPFMINQLTSSFPFRNVNLFVESFDHKLAGRIKRTLMASA